MQEEARKGVGAGLEEGTDRLSRIFLDRLERSEIIVAIVGLGYVGLPLASAMCSAGLTVVGIDIDADKVSMLNRGETYIRHVSSSAIKRFVERKQFRATNDFSVLQGADAVVVCVPTPLTRQREPDLSYVVNTVEQISPHAKPGMLLILESTTWPGTTSEVVAPILERSGFRTGRDVFVAFSPEREDPGNTSFVTSGIPKVVGADDAVALRLATALYGRFIETVVPVSSSRVAEAVKLTENIFRSVNIALVNELKIIYQAMGIDIWEVVEAAKTKPFGYMPFYPGPGLGGHCIPIDPFYLTWKAREHEISTRFIELAGEINTFMPRWVVQRVADAVDRRFGKGLRDSRVLIVGIAYKKNVDDIRESASLKLMELFQSRGSKVDYHDPFVSIIPPTREHMTLTGRKSVPFDTATVGDYDCVLIATDHDNIDYSILKDHARLAVDTRNVLSRKGIQAGHFEKA